MEENGKKHLFKSYIKSCQISSGKNKDFMSSDIEIAKWYVIVVDNSMLIYLIIK